MVAHVSASWCILVHVLAQQLHYKNVYVNTSHHLSRQFPQQLMIHSGVLELFSLLPIIFNNPNNLITLPDLKSFLKCCRNANVSQAHMHTKKTTWTIIPNIDFEFAVVTHQAGLEMCGCWESFWKILIEPGKLGNPNPASVVYSSSSFAVTLHAVVALHLA